MALVSRTPRGSTLTPEGVVVAEWAARLLAVAGELAVAEELGSHRLARVPVVGVDLRRSLRAVWSGGELPPAGAARDLLAHVSAGRPADGTAHG